MIGTCVCSSCCLFNSLECLAAFLRYWSCFFVWRDVYELYHSGEKTKKNSYVDLVYFLLLCDGTRLELAYSYYPKDVERCQKCKGRQYTHAHGNATDVQMPPQEIIFCADISCQTPSPNRAARTVLGCPRRSRSLSLQGLPRVCISVHSPGWIPCCSSYFLLTGDVGARPS